MSDYKNTVRGVLSRFIGHGEDTWYVGESQIFFSDRSQGVKTPLGVEIAISVNEANEVFPGEDYYVET